MSPLRSQDVARYYRWLLDREPDPEALAYFAAIGSSRLSLVRAIVASDEFAMRHQDVTGLVSKVGPEPELSVRDVAFWDRYAPTRHPDSPAPFREVAPGLYRLTADRPAPTLRSPHSASALALLYALARDHWSGAGEIVEFGVGAGLTTRCLSEGVAGNTRVSPASKAQRLYAFDRFRSAEVAVAASGEPASRTAHVGSGFAAFMSRQRDETDTIVPCPGELAHLTWGDHPVELLVINSARAWSAHAWILQRLFPRLIPGQSVIVQANRGSTTGYWRHLVMARFADRFEVLPGMPGSSPSYLCRSVISPNEVALDLTALPFEEKERLLREALARHPESARLALQNAYAAFLIAHGQSARARDILSDVDRESASPHDPTQDQVDGLRLDRDRLRGAGMDAERVSACGE